jgi:polysaccharide pyruvyl transferase CsaB
VTDGPAAPAGRRRPRVFLVGYYGVGNVGDEAIRSAIERAADALGVDVVAYASRTASDDPRAVRTGPRGAIGHVRAILAADRVVLGGGGILKDEGRRLPLELLATTLAARLLRRPVRLLAVGVGPFYRRSGRWLVRATARLSAVRTVRDEASAAALRGLGVGHVRVAADPIFSMGSGPDGAVPSVPAADSLPPDAPAVVSIRPWFHTLPDAGERERRVAALRSGLATGLAPLADAGVPLTLVPLYWPRDRDESRRLEPLLDRARVEVVDRPLDWDGLAAQVAAARLVIAMRYHAVAAAALAGRPVVAIAYEPKVASLAADLGIPVIDVAAADLGERLAAVLSAGLADPATMLADPAAVDALRQRAWSALRSALLD